MSVTIGGNLRKGKTKYETILQSLFKEIDVNCITDSFICLKCGGIYPLPNSSNYPNSCKKCGGFSEAGSYVMPDLIIKHHNGYDDSKAVIFVNGAVHTKKSRIKKDENQIYELIKKGFRIFVFENDDVQTLRDQKTFITQAALREIYDSIKFHFKYDALIENEKEMAGANIIRGGLAEHWVK